MKVSEMLSSKLDTVFCTNGNASICVAVGKMLEHNIGALPVIEDKKLIGIISERDILKICSVDQKGSETVKVKELMTDVEGILTCKLDDKLESVMETMTNKRVRHLPVMENDKVIGIVSIGDLVKTLLDAAKKDNQLLNDYINGGYPA